MLYYTSMLNYHLPTALSNHFFDGKNQTGFHRSVSTYSPTPCIVFPSTAVTRAFDVRSPANSTKSRSPPGKGVAISKRGRGDVISPPAGFWFTKSKQDNILRAHWNTERRLLTPFWQRTFFNSEELFLRCQSMSVFIY